MTLRELATEFKDTVARERPRSSLRLAVEGSRRDGSGAGRTLGFSNFLHGVERTSGSAAKYLEASTLNLPDPFPRHVQSPADLREGPLSSVVEAEPQPEHLLPTRFERRQKPVQMAAHARSLDVPDELRGL